MGAKYSPGSSKPLENVPLGGLEPPTYRLALSRSVQLSYRGPAPRV